MHFKLYFALPLVFIAAHVVFSTDAPQSVEGFASILHSPSANSRPGLSLDFRGPSQGYMTPPWWTTGTHERLKCKTAPVPEKRATVFAFIGASSVIPPEFSQGPRARLFVDGKPAITFEIGQTRDRVWKEGDIQLRYVTRRSEWPYSAAHREFSLNGDSGIYRPSVPASYVTPGQPVTLKVELLPFPAWPNGWFMVKDRTDTLKESEQSLSEQVQQLQRDVTRLGEVTEVLAANQYSQLTDSRAMQHSVIYTDGWRHLHPPDLIRLKNGDLLVMAREAAEHIARDGDVIMLRSKDDGKTWGEKQVIANLKNVG